MASTRNLNETISTNHTRTKSIDFHNKTKSCLIPRIEMRWIFTNTKTKLVLPVSENSFSARPHTPSQLRPTQKPSQPIHTKTKLFRPTHETKSIPPPADKDQVNFNSYPKIMIIPIPRLNSSNFYHAQKNQASFEAHTKPSHSRPAHKNEVYFDHQHKYQVNFDPDTQTKSVYIHTPQTSPFRAAHRHKFNFDPPQ